MSVVLKNKRIYIYLLSLHILVHLPESRVCAPVDSTPVDVVAEGVALHQKDAHVGEGAEVDVRPDWILNEPLVDQREVQPLGYH